MYYCQLHIYIFVHINYKNSNLAYSRLFSQSLSMFRILLYSPFSSCFTSCSTLRFPALFHIFP